ncbi:fungal specific transcription factor domain containing protein [Diplodia corticola]|uniref:Fungal specific transcription factor domain containing protein n=1 Tax=Diplodia corticola TaxID=236234 RepID=A0A1J9QZY7_9PEZI|nr:fungal specific transcription factor domain containing protein [Diplodia corticola]OJD34662.1 fungal specific transcription factor domain containing protein [Diplodia corticola]
MPPRIPACRSAVHHTVLRHAQPIWITDDVLADAFHRFLNVSDANRKRYGSNVPGPLEARRRASRRRMMGLATAAPGIGPDIGALFGADQPLHQSWSWEPPMKPEQSLSREKPRPSALPKWLSNHNGSAGRKQSRFSDPIGEYSHRLAGVRDTTELESLWSYIGVEPQHTVLFSQMAMTHFLAIHKESHGIKTPNARIVRPQTQSRYGMIFAFLQNPKLNVPEARNIKTLIDFKISDGMPLQRLGQLISTIQNSLRLGTMLPSELHDIVDSIPQLCATVCPHPSMVNDWQFGAYRAIWLGMNSCRRLPVDHFDTSIVRKIVEAVLVLDTPPIPRCGPHPVHTLFRVAIYRHLWPTNNDARSHGIAAHLAIWVQRLGKLGISGSTCTSDGLGWHVIKSVLESMSSRRAREVMQETLTLLLPLGKGVALDEGMQNTLRLWFSCISQTCHVCPYADRHLAVVAPNHEIARRFDPVLAIAYFELFSMDQICQFWMHFWVPQYVGQDMGAKKRKLRADKLQSAYKKRIEQSDATEDPRVTSFFNVIMVLKDQNLPYQTTLSKAVELILAMHGPDVAHELYTRLVLARVPIDRRAAAAVIEAMSDENPRKALKFFRAIGDVWLSLCPRLVLALIEHGSLPRDELFALLDHNDPLARVPPEHRRTLTDSTSALRLELVHLVAHAYAGQTAYPTRHRFRNVHYCYLWLRDRRAPLLPLLSKALVRAGVTAPLENNEWVSTVRLRWVLRLVREIEGADVAASLDRLVWHWRGEVIREARRRWDSAGLFARFGPSTVGMARRAGLFADDFPSWRRCYRKVVVNAGFLAPKCVRRPRFKMRGSRREGRRLWGGLDRRLGGKGDSEWKYSPWKWRQEEAY